MFKLYIMDILRKSLYSIVLMAIPIFSGYAQENNPAAAPEAVVISGNARFTVLTSKLIRMEWAGDGKFEDRATFGVVNRNLPVPEFKVSKSARRLVINTGDVVLTYTGSERFSGENLSVSFQMPYTDGRGKSRERTVVWKPGADDSGNLLGTMRTLDKCDGPRPAEAYDKGVISRDGWAVLDESDRPVTAADESDWGEWVAERDTVDRLDLYMFAYGHDYKDAIMDFTKIAGKVPLPPKYAFGYWWSRYWQYSDYEFVDLAKTIRSMDIPIDVMVVDMDWHETWTLRKKNAPKDEFGQRIGWTGYSWQKQLFPDPANFLEEIHRLGLKTSLNLHPASGIQPYEESYGRFVGDFLSRTDEYDGPEGYVGEDGKPVPVPFRITDRNWTDAYFNSVIHPLEEQGVDFWWLDWQQWKQCKYMPSVSNTFWLNWTFFNDKVRRSRSLGMYADRPMIYHRWGGIGSHRYQIGFSGDTYDSWEVLGYLPFFTSTASNVCYGYWGHDIGGHMQKKDHETDPELYTRWLQYGVFTPIFKTHSTKTRFLERRIWTFPGHFEAMRDAIRLRYTLSPYIYGAARQTYDTGISMCRPMYYDYPEAEEAYGYREQYMFGDRILATAICHPADSVTGLSGRTVWFPAGDDWYDMATGMIYKGGQVASLSYTIDENPYYVKAGSVIVMAPENITSLQEQNDGFRIFVAPGDGCSSAVLYEDDGKSQAYCQEFATTMIHKDSGSNSVRISVDARKGGYAGMPAGRQISLTLECILPPVSVKVNGREIPYSRFLEDDTWTYDGMDMAVNIRLGEMDASVPVEVECVSDTVYSGNVMGKKGLFRRMARLTPEVKYVFGDYIDRYLLLPVPFLKVAQCPSFITEDPDGAAGYLDAVDIDGMDSALGSYGELPEDFLLKVRAQSMIGQ